jgi:diguanylate cyclase (GGDEF)-like protein/PAS domain S-box-containing protein
MDWGGEWLPGKMTRKDERVAPITESTSSKRTSSRRAKQATRRAKQATNSSVGSAEENSIELIHELRTHQIELELQNEELRRIQQELLQSRQKYTDLYDFAPSGYLTLSDKGLIAQLNHRTAELLGKKRDQLVNQSLFQYIEITDRDILFLWLRKARNSNRPEICELRFQNPKGHLHVQLRGYVSQIAGNSCQYLITLTDITERVMASERILMLSQAVEQSPVSVVITDPGACIEYVNPAFERITGYQAQDVIGLDCRTLGAGDTCDTTALELWTSVAQGHSWQGEVENKKKTGEPFWEQVNIAPVVDEFGVVKHFLDIREDISVRKQQEQRILRQARFDNLTDLPNRFLALDRLARMIVDARRNNYRVAVLFLDLDDFKKVNDSMGHEVGDQLLVTAAERLRKAVRLGDTIARLGGDEFLVILGNLSEPADTLPVLESILRVFRELCMVDGHELLLTSSIGIATFPEDGEDSKRLLRNADLAMYQSKLQGGDTYTFFTEAMNKKIARRISLEEKMHGALARNEFEVLFQPQINLKSGRIDGAEALLRWHSPEYGSVSPSEFIPVAEQTGLVLSLGQFVLQEAMHVASCWQQKYFPGFRLAVNLSPRQLRDPELPAFIESVLAQTGFLNTALELEITEGILITGYTNISEILNALLALGVSISMDDFGTGYTSLKNLRKYPFHTIKIDRSFIGDNASRTADWELVNAIITMGHSLHLNIVAEGVETADQFDKLKAMGCDYAQGFLIKEALSAADFLRAEIFG